MPGDVFACHNLGRGYFWHLAGRGHGRCYTSHNVQDSPTALTDNDPAQKVSSAKDDKLLFPHLCSQVEPVDPKVVVTSIFCD